MKISKLSNHFKGVAFKKLSNVEVQPAVSNQHEFNGVQSLKALFGTEKRTFDARFLYLGDDEEDTLAEAGFVTWYDSREHTPDRSEYRCYYSSTDIITMAREGDLCVIGLTQADSVIVVIALAGSTGESQLQWLFNTSVTAEPGFKVKPVEKNDDKSMGYIERTILSQIGIDVPVADDTMLEKMLLEFNKGFPSTRAFSAFAQATSAKDADPKYPDDALIIWMDHEEVLFRTLERYMVGIKLKDRFEDVDSFISYSLSVQNRRKSRAGYALENHFERILIENNVSYTRGAETENKARPDFIFPGGAQYRDDQFPVKNLTMLGVKSTCKDRWRQVLAEALRIKDKHLLTLEPGISINQTNEMTANSLQLVIPKGIHETYQKSQQNHIISVTDFLNMLKERQADSIC